MWQAEDVPPLVVQVQKLGGLVTMWLLLVLATRQHHLQVTPQRVLVPLFLQRLLLQEPLA